MVDVSVGETILLSGQDGPTFFLIPVMGDVAAEERELRRAIAKSNLRRNWKVAAESRTLSDREINREVEQVRAARQRRKAK